MPKRRRGTLRLRRTGSNCHCFTTRQAARDCIDAANHALQLKPDYAEAYNNIAAGYQSLGQWDDAIRASQQALRLNPNLQIASNNLAYASQQKQRAQSRPIHP